MKNIITTMLAVGTSAALGLASANAGVVNKEDKVHIAVNKAAVEEGAWMTAVNKDDAVTNAAKKKAGTEASVVVSSNIEAGVLTRISSDGVYIKVGTSASDTWTANAEIDNTGATNMEVLSDGAYSIANIGANEATVG